MTHGSEPSRKSRFLGRLDKRNPPLQRQHDRQPPEQQDEHGKPDEFPEWHGRVSGIRVGEPCVPGEDGAEGEEDADIEQVVNAFGEMGVEFFVSECSVAAEDGTGEEACEEFI